MVRGPVTLDAHLLRDVLRRGERVDLQLEITAAAGWTVSPHRPAERGGVPLSVTLIDPELGAGTAVYSESTAAGHVVRVPVRVPSDADLGRRSARLVVRFEACRAGGACEPPERVTLEAPLTVTR
jgi:hypothetical protein